MGGGEKKGMKKERENKLYVAGEKKRKKKERIYNGNRGREGGK